MWAFDTNSAAATLERLLLIQALHVYASNVMAMLGLRSLYFVLADALPRLRYLRHGLALILLFTGTKMLTNDWVRVGAGRP